MSVGLAAKKKRSAGSKKLLTLPALGSPTPRKPHGFQWRGSEHLVTHGGAGIFANPGTGKTAIVERAFKALKDAGVAEHMLVIAPLRVCYNVWPEEGKEWAGGDWDCLADLKVSILHGNKKELRLNDDADIFVINPDGLKWLCADNYRRLKALGVDTLIVDESTKFKNTQTQRFKMMKKALHLFKRRWIMTGTPNPRSYMDLFGQIFLIDAGVALGRYISHFRAQFFTPVDKFGWEWVLTHDADKEIQKLIAPYIFYLDSDDYVKMPKIIENVIRVDLPEDARKIYDEMEEEFVAQLSDATIVQAISSGSKAMKCAQIANGGLYHERYSDENFDIATGKFKKDRCWTLVHEAKLDAVEDIIDELNGEPAMVVYDYKHDLIRLRERFGKDIPYIGGGVNAKRSKEIEDAWNRDELGPILFVHPQAVGHGLNMQKGSARNIIWHSMTYDLELYDQLNKRLARQGSRYDNIFVHQILAVNTVDVAKARALKKKGESQRNFLKALKEYAIERGLYKPVRKKNLTPVLAQDFNDDDVPF